MTRGEFTAWTKTLHFLAGSQASPGRIRIVTDDAIYECRVPDDEAAPILIETLPKPRWA